MAGKFVRGFAGPGLAVLIGVFYFCLAGTARSAGVNPAGAPAANPVVADAVAPDSPAVEGEETRLRGRDFVRLGELKTLAGELKKVHGEWYLVVDGLDHELHLGDHEHRARTGIALEQGKPAVVTGLVYRQEKMKYVDVAVCTITLDGREYRFRNDDGTPLWRGRSAGEGAGENAGEGERQGSGRGERRGAGGGAGRAR